MRKRDFCHRYYTVNANGKNVDRVIKSLGEKSCEIKGGGE